MLDAGEFGTEQAAAEGGEEGDVAGGHEPAPGRGAVGNAGDVDGADCGASKR